MGTSVRPAPVVVFDTNVLISALGWAGNPEACWTLAQDGVVQSATSQPILDELRRVMAYPRFEFSEADKTVFYTSVVRSSEVVAPTESITAIEADPDDDMILECAVAADTDYIVSGDDHLLDLGAFREIEIVAPAALLESIADAND